ncbi:hypothetical protein ScPMuIL_015544 [Solemya velum]
MVTVEQLYKHFGVLADAKDKAGEHEEEYSSIISAVKGGSGEKRLASQFIARFFKFFPKQAHDAINALFDLCEDDNINIRKQAIKDLTTLCKVNNDYVPKISEALTQLLQCDDSAELSLVQSSLSSLFSIGAKGTLQGIYAQIMGEEDVVREKALKFLTVKLATLPDETLDKEAEDFVIAECKKVLQDVTKDEFIDLVTIMKCLKSMNTVQGRQQLVDLITEQAELDQPFDASDTDSVDRLIQCIKQCSSLFSKNVHSRAFVAYICDNVIPALPDLVTSEEGADIRLDILKVLAEISEFAGELEQEDTKVEKVFIRLLEYMPLPPSEENDDLTNGTEEPKLQFSFVECLMFTFHQLGRKCPGFLTDENNAERLKDFRIRLQYFARGVQVYIKQLRAALQGKTGEELKTDENKIKVVALKITSNINTLIKDLFHNPPSYKSTLTLSWQPLLVSKRITPITFDAGDPSAKKLNREARQIYAPPGGKFSEKAGTYQQQGGGRGSFRGGRGRGRGGGFRGKYW